MVGYSLRNTLSAHGSVNRGLCKTINGNLDSVEEITGISTDSGGDVVGTDTAGSAVQLDPHALVSMNFWGFSDSIFPGLENHLTTFLNENMSSETAEFYIPTFIDDLIKTGAIKCRMLKTVSNWFGVTYPDDLPAVKAEIRGLILRNTYPSSLLA